MEYYDETIYPILLHLSKCDQFRSPMINSRLIGHLINVAAKNITNSQLVAASCYMCTMLMFRYSSGTDERFITQFMQAQGPEFIMYVLGVYENIDLKGMMTEFDIMASSFLSFLPIVEIASGRAWIAKNCLCLSKYIEKAKDPSIVNTFKFIDEGCKFKLKMMWKKFLDIYESEIEQYREENLVELLREEEREKVLKSKKRDRRKVKKHNKKQQVVGDNEDHDALSQTDMGSQSRNENNHSKVTPQSKVDKKRLGHAKNKSLQCDDLSGKTYLDDHQISFDHQLFENPEQADEWVMVGTKKAVMKNVTSKPQPLFQIQSTQSGLVKQEGKYKSKQDRVEHKVNECNMSWAEIAKAKTQLTENQGPILTSGEILMESVTSTNSKSPVFTQGGRGTNESSGLSFQEDYPTMLKTQHEETIKYFTDFPSLNKDTESSLDHCLTNIKQTTLNNVSKEPADIIDTSEASKPEDRLGKKMVPNSHIRMPPGFKPNQAVDNINWWDGFGSLHITVPSFQEPINPCLTLNSSSGVMDKSQSADVLLPRHMNESTTHQSTANRSQQVAEFLQGQQRLMSLSIFGNCSLNPEGLLPLNSYPHTDIPYVQNMYLVPQLANNPKDLIKDVAENQHLPNVTNSFSSGNATYPLNNTSATSTVPLAHSHLSNYEVPISPTATKASYYSQDKHNSNGFSKLTKSEGVTIPPKHPWPDHKEEYDNYLEQIWNNAVILPPDYKLPKNPRDIKPVLVPSDTVLYPSVLREDDPSDPETSSDYSTQSSENSDTFPSFHDGTDIMSTTFLFEELAKEQVKLHEKNMPNKPVLKEVVYHHDLDYYKSLYGMIPNTNNRERLSPLPELPLKKNIPNCATPSMPSYSSIGVSNVPKASEYGIVSRRWRSMLEEIRTLPKTMRRHIGTIIIPLQSAEYNINPQGNSVILGHLADGTEIAVKVVDGKQTRIDKKLIERLNSPEMKHHFLLKYLAIEESSDKHYIASELCDYTLEEYIHIVGLSHQHDPLSAYKLSWQLLKGLHYLHIELNIVHGNIKPQNIYVDFDGKLRLGGYGVDRSERLDRLISKPYKKASSRLWRATECLADNEDSEPTTKGDVQVAGMLIYYILTGGSHPYGENPYEIEVNICQNWGQMAFISQEANDLISAMLFLDISSRPTLDQCLSHPFFWSEEKRFRLVLIAGSDVLKEMKTGIPVTGTGSTTMIDFLNIVPTDSVSQDWMSDLDPVVLKDMRSFRQYKNSLSELVLFLYNCCLHFDKMSPPAREVMDDPCQYFLARFPNLFMAVYGAIKVSDRTNRTCYKPFYSFC